MIGTSRLYVCGGVFVVPSMLGTLETVLVALLAKRLACGCRLPPTHVMLLWARRRPWVLLGNCSWSAPLRERVGSSRALETVFHTTSVGIPYAGGGPDAVLHGLDGIRHGISSWDHASIGRECRSV